MNPMRRIEIEKVTLNIGVGEGGEKLAKAERVLERLAGRKPSRTHAKRTVRDFNIRLGEPIGCVVTLRGREAEAILKRLFDAVERRVRNAAFDDRGNLAFGIKEYIDIPGVEYDPEIGIFGLDVCVTLRRPGYRIKHRKRQRRMISKSHLIKREEAIGFISKNFGVQAE